MPRTLKRAHRNDPLASPDDLQFPKEFEPLEFLMLTHYSTELLFSPEARAGFVEPDRDPIPRYGR